MAIAPARLSQFWSGIRATPFMFLFHALAMVAAYPSPRNILYLAAYCFNFVFNGITKMSMKALYQTLGVKRLPLLGLGMRPSGATNCGTFLTWPNVPAITYGMPSGHSQNAWFFSTFMLLELWRYYKSGSATNDTNKSADNIVSKHPAMAIMLGVGLIGFATVVSYSRVWIEGCHTLEQVIVGGLLGIGLGFASHYAVSVILAKVWNVTSQDDSKLLF